MATLEQRFQTFRTYVETYTGRTTYEADSGFTQPNPPYCTVKLILAKPYQHEVNRDIDGITEEIRGLTTLSYSVQAIGGDVEAGTDSLQTLKRLALSFSADVPQRFLTDQGIGVLDVGEVLGVSTITGSKIEDRSSMIITLSASVPEVFDYESATEATIEIDPGVDPAQTITIPPDEPACPV